MTGTEARDQHSSRFDLIAGNLCLDFINTLDDRPSGKPRELLKDYCDLARFGRATKILKPEQLSYFNAQVRRHPDEAQETVLRAHQLREALHDIVSSLTNHRPPRTRAMKRFNASLHDAAQHLRLAPQEKAGRSNAGRKGQRRSVRLEWRFDDSTFSFDAILWPIIRSAGELLASSNMQLVRTCSSATCQWFFLDTSKNHQRRWCSMKLCGNRAKVRKFYARKRRIKSAGA